MVFIACGLNHKTTPLDLREKMLLTPSLQGVWLQRLVAESAVHEAAILTTCNRTEIYCETEDTNAILPWLAKAHLVPEQSLAPFLYYHHDEQGIRHMLRVATGLDSMMLGEPQILGQMKQAYQQACTLGTAKTNLRLVFDHTFSASKRIRHQSGLGKNPISVAFAAVSLMTQRFTSLAGLRVFLIGSGETIALVAKYLHEKGVTNFYVASRTDENAQALAGLFQASAVPLDEIPQYLAKVDVVISATACPFPFITKNMIIEALAAREESPLFLLDLAVPRDIEPEVGLLPAICLYNIDDLQHISEAGMDKRRSAAVYAEILIEEELKTYTRKLKQHKINDILCKYRAHMQDLAQSELARAKLKLSRGQSPDLVFEEFARLLINKLTHSPLLGLRQAASDGQDELLDLVQYLFSTTTKPLYEEIT